LRRVDVGHHGKPEVTGYLTLTRIVRPVTLNPGEDYFGPVYGDSVIRTATRAVRFALSTNNLEEKAETAAESRFYRENCGAVRGNHRYQLAGGCPMRIAILSPRPRTTPVPLAREL